MATLREGPGDALQPDRFPDSAEGRHQAGVCRVPLFT